MTDLVLNNPIAWAQLHLRGGWTRIGAASAGIGGVLVALITLTVWADPASAAEILANWTFGLLLGQVGVLLLFGSARVAGAVRKDLDTHMIESHRVMPVPPTVAVAGYVIGGAAPAVTLAVVVFSIGAFTTAGGGIAFERWAVPNLVLLATAACAWVLVAFLAFVSRGATAMLLFLIIPLSNIEVAYLLPALAMMAEPTVRTAVAMRTSGSEIGWPTVLALVSMAAVSAHFFAGACRRYRRADAQALGPYLGLSLLATMVVLSLVARASWELITSSPWAWDRVEDRVQVLATTFVLTALALVPVLASADNLVAWRRRRRRPRDPAGADAGAGARPLGPVVAAALAAAVMSPLGLMSAGWTPARLACAGLALFAALVPVGCGWQLLPVGRGRIGALGLWVILAWAAPVVVDGIRAVNAAPAFGDPELGVVSALSPVGLLLLIWQDFPAGAGVLGPSPAGTIATGLIAMGAIAVAAVVLVRLPVVARARRLRHSTDRPQLTDSEPGSG